CGPTSVNSRRLCYTNSIRPCRGFDNYQPTSVPVLAKSHNKDSAPLPTGLHTAKKRSRPLFKVSCCRFLGMPQQTCLAQFLCNERSSFYGPCCRSWKRNCQQSSPTRIKLRHDTPWCSIHER